MDTRAVALLQFSVNCALKGLNNSSGKSCAMPQALLEAASGALIIEKTGSKYARRFLKPLRGL